MSANEALTERVSGSEDNYTMHKYMLSRVQRQSTVSGTEQEYSLTSQS